MTASIRRLVAAWRCCALVVLTVWSSAARAQSVDSLTKLLRSRDVHVRGDAVVRLTNVNTADLPAATRTAIISLLEHEALGDVANADTMPLSENDETWGGEIDDLTNLVMRMRDPPALRGVALLGMQTSKAAQEFVADFGPRAMPVLDEAWTRRPDMRPDVDITWGLMLGPGHPAVVAGSLARLARNDRGFICGGRAAERVEGADTEVCARVEHPAFAGPPVLARRRVHPVAGADSRVLLGNNARNLRVTAAA